MLLLVVAGPTAVGKTELSLRLAELFKAELFSCDSRQFYRELNIGTAKPSAEELERVPHHFINNKSIADDYSVGDYEREVIPALETYFREHQVAILVGGSGLFIRAVCEGLDEFPEVSEEVRHQVREQYEWEGIGFLRKLVAEKDPDYFARVDQDNPRRLMRAAEIILASGKPFSYFRRQEPKPRPFRILKIALHRDRTELYDRINQRVDGMVAAGLEQEAKAVLPFREKNALQTVGYQEFFDYFDGQLSKDRAVELIKQNSRRYAKRQLTWLRNQGGFHPFAPNDESAILELVQGTLDQ